MVRTYQGGSILSFVAIGSVLALLLIGGVYFAKHNLAPKDDKQRLAQQDESVGNDDKTKDSDEVGSSEEGDVRQDESASQSDRVDSDEGDDQAEEGALPVAGSSEGDSDPEVLPQTGPGDTLVSAAMLGLVVALYVSYRRSRNLASSL